MKGWAWEERKPVTTDQFFFFGKQLRRESVLASKVDVAITDAPTLTIAYYTQVFGAAHTAAIFRLMALEARRLMQEQRHDTLDVWLTRCKPYDPRGRFQTEAEAKNIDVDLLAFLTSMNVKLLHVKADDDNAVAKIIEAAQEKIKFAIV